MNEKRTEPKLSLADWLYQRIDYAEKDLRDTQDYEKYRKGWLNALELVKTFIEDTEEAGVDC